MNLRYFANEVNAQQFCDVLHERQMTMIPEYAAEFNAGRIQKEKPIPSPVRGWIVSYQPCWRIN